jgi:iron complex transport system substrate-binding protein
MRRNFQLMIVALIGALVFSACNSTNNQPVPGPISLIDGLGRTVSLPAPAQKVVSLAPSNTEILFAIGAGAQVVGRDDFSDYPAQAKSLPSVGGNMGNYDVETIASLKPDLVLASELNTPELVQTVEKLGIPVYYLSNPTDLEGLYANLQTVGKLTGHEKDTETLVDSLKVRVEGITLKLAGNKVNPLVYYELDATDAAKPWTPGPGTFLTKLIKLAGGKSIGESLTSDYAQIGLETLLTQNPDIILLGDAAYGTTPEQVAQRNGWQSIKAVLDNKIYTFDDNLVSRPGPRLVDGLEILAKLLHLEIFK